MKNFNLIEKLQGCSKRNGTAVYASNPDGQTTVKRQSRVMSQSGCSAVDVSMTSYGAPDEHPMSIRSASDGTRWNSRGWKYVAMIFAVLVMSMANVGLAWGTDVFSAVPIAGSDLSAKSLTTFTAFTSSQATISGGTLSYKQEDSNDKGIINTSIGPTGDKRKCFRIETNKCVYKMVLSGALQNGDVIAADLYNNNVELWFSTSESRPSSAPSTKLASGGTSSQWNAKSYTVTTGDGICGQTTIYIHRNSNTTHFSYLTITRAAASEWQVKGLDDGTWAGFNMTGTGTVTCSRSLSANTQYTFKLYNTSTSKWWGNGTMYKYTREQTIVQADAGENCYLRTSKAGTYTFSFNTSTKALTVTYPDDYKGYWTKNGASWSKVYAYCYNDGTWKNADWPGVEITDQTEDICGTHYYINTSGYTTVIFNNGGSGSGNQTGNIAISGGEGKRAVGAAATAFEAFTYNVTYDANGGTGTVPTDATNYASGASVAVPDNTGNLTKSGYYFAGWNTKADGSGDTYVLGQTFSITSCTTLYAKWNAVSCPDGSVDGTVFKLQMNNVGTKKSIAANEFINTAIYATMTNGSAIYGATEASKGEVTNATPGKLKFGGQAVSLKLNLGCPLQAGDIISFTAGESAELSFATSSTRVTSPATSSKSYTIPGGSGLIDASTLYVWRSGSTTLSITSLTITRPGGCTAPTALSAGSTTAKGTTFTVTDGANTNDYEIVCKTTSGTPAADATPTYTSTSKTKAVTDLVAGTKYYAWVRSKCSASNKSDWVSGGNFTTSTVTVTHTLTNVSKTSGGETAGGSDYTAVYAADAEYSMPTPTVTIDGNTATSGTDYTWSSGTLTIPANKINGNIVITLNSADAAPSSAVISGTYHYFPGDNISLTCTPTGNNGPTTYQWYKGGKENGNAIAGATSATYTKNSCAFADAGSYYCKVTCNATSIWANTNSSENYDVKILRLYVNGSKSGYPYGNVDFVKVDGTTATASISLGSNWTYGFNIADGCGHYYGNAGTMTENNCGPWVTNVNGTDCGLTTTNAATYIFTINYSNLSSITTTVTYPSANQASGKVIYFDNNVLKWTGSSIYYRIGHSSHSQADQLSLVPGTANLYKMTTREYNGFSAWQIGNAEGGNGSNKSIYNTQNSPAITASIAYEGGAVTAAAVTVTPGADHSKGGDAQNNNCEFYSKTITNGMKKDRVTISQPSNGTITIHYTNENGVSTSSTAAVADMIEDLAHTVILTSITTSPNEGYDAGAITINGGAYSANYVVTGTTTIAATFTPQVYSITYKDQGGAAFSGSHAAGHPTTHTYGTATTLKTASKTGYTFGGWYGNPECTGEAQTSIGATSITAGIILYAKWTPNQYSVSHSLSNVTKTSGATGANAATYGTNYTAVFAASSGYALPETITVTIGGSTKTAGTEYTWDQGTGTVTIGGSYITGDIVITVSAAGGCPTGGDIFTLVMDYSSSSATKVPANSTLDWSDSYGDVDGGTVTLGNKHASSTDHMQVVKTNTLKFGGNDGYVKIDLDCPLKTGDIISFTSEETNQISFTKTDTRATSPATSNKKWTVTAAYDNVSTIYLWRASGSTVNLHTINITRPVTVTFDKNGGSSVSPTSTTYDGTAEITLPEPVRADYRCTGWNTAIGGDGTDLGLPGETYRPNVTTNTQTIYAQWVEKSCASGTIYKFLTKTDLANGDLSTKNELFYVMTSNYLANLTGGRLQAFANGSNLTISDGKNFKFNDNSSYLLLTLDCPLRATDHMKWKVSSQDLVITKTSTRATTIALTKGDGDVAVPEGLVGAKQLWIWKGSSSGGKISYFEIIRSASTYNVTYDGNDQTSTAGTVPTDATNYAYNATVTTAAQGSLAKTNYTFGGWNTANDGTGTNTAAGSTFSITDNTTLYAKWTQAVTLDANTANHGSTDGSATAVWNATGLTGITHATPVSGYKLTGYYTTASGDGVKVLNSDGSFASSNVTDYITSGKWSRTEEAPTLYARYESSGALIWNLGVNTNATSLTTSSKESSFTQIAVANMGDATLSGSTYTKSAKSSLTGKISSPATKSDYVYVTFKVADGYKFTPSNISVKVQPVGENEHKAVELSLADATNTLASSSATKCNGTSSGTTTTVTLAGNGTYFTGTVTLKIYVYAHATATATTYNCYRLGTPITIEGAVEATCVMPSFTGLDYDQTSYTVSEPASAISVTGASNVSYLWKQNSTNDRSGITPASGTNDEASYTPPTGAAGTMYYWCELTNACGTVKTPAVGITVSATKSDATISWTGTSASANYGGGGYTVKATVEQTGWNGNAADLTLSAPAGIRIYNIESGETASQKWVQASFDVTTAFDRETYSSTIPFVVTADATATYNAISDEEDVTFDACTGGGGEGSAFVEVTSAVTTAKTGMSNYWEAVGVGRLNKAYNQAMGSSADAQTIEGHSFSYRTGANNSNWMVNPYIAGVTKIRLYFYASAAIASGKLGISKVLYDTEYFSSQGSRSVVYDNVATNADSYAAADKGWIEFTLPEMAANSYCYFSTNTGNLYVYGVELFSGSVGSGGSQKTNLTWSQDVDESDAKKVTKKTTDAYFTITANRADAVTRESLGAITYSSSVPSVATVDPSTGKVSMVAAGTTIIKATLAASGCFKKKEITYKLEVEEEECSIAAGTLALTSGLESKCRDDEVTLTLTGFESEATLQWKDGDTDITNGGNYTITKNGTTSTLTTNQPGTYSVIVTKGCFVRSNRITIKNASAEASVSKIIDEWYIKQGRLTPDIALFNAEGATSFTIKDASTDAEVTSIAGCTFELQDDVIYLHGYSTAGVGPTGIESAANETIKVVVTDACGNEASAGNIIIHKQIRTDKHVLAFVVNGTAKGGFTEGITADQTTNVGLYNAIAAQFDVQATNIYATDDEKKLKEYYSQYDILCITDYPNTKTKGVNSKSYVDAIGALIDIRPILTMEAFVSSLANWRAKGISGNPKSPTTRQYTMDLQCKDHEIFAGTDLTKVGEGDEAMYRVSMVDNTKEEYVSLDATYGGGAHAEKDGYNYGGKPALQGFTFTEEMANDLLPIGLINDGADNPLQVGIERQRNMEARLMVLGINSYAMERLTNDGERVVINALNYLMKKNQEDIADCSTAFVGGAEGHEKNWDYADNWTGNTVPLPTQKVRILADCEVSSTVYAQSVLIVTDGQYNHGSDIAAGKLTIKENGALIVSGKVQAASAPAYNRPRATTPDKLLIETSSTNQAALIFDNEEGETQATVNYYSLGRKPSSYQYQYFAVPMEVVPVNPTFANETHGGTGIYTYVYNEATSGWTRRGYYDDLLAFEGLGITTKSTGAMEYTMTGNLASTATKEITLTKNGRGLNLIGNSWMAPIQIGALAEDNTDANITKTVYIYCAGRDAEGGAQEGDAATETAGQWIPIPFEASGTAGWRDAGKLSVIPAMQAFQIKTAAEATLTLDYKKVVRGSTNDLNAKLRAPGRRDAANEVTMTNIRVADSKTHTDLSLFEGDRFSEAFDNGWEAEYMNGDGRSAKLYAETETGKMAVVAMEDYEGTVVGFAPGKETEYTFSFMGEDNGYYLNDIKLKNSVRISEGETYTFTYEEGDAANRFYISRQPLGGPAITTGVDEVREETKPRKFIYNDKMYILFNGRVFDATGKAVK